MERPADDRQKPRPWPKPLLSGPARLVGKRLHRRKRGKGYRPESVDIVGRNVCDGFQVLCQEAAAVEALRALGPVVGKAAGRDQLLEAWPRQPQLLLTVLQQNFALAAREFLWEEPKDAAIYGRSTSSAIKDFLEWIARQRGSNGAP